MKDRGLPARLLPTHATSMLGTFPQDQLLALNADRSSTPLFKYDSSREGTDTSVGAHSFFSLFAPPTGGSYDDFVMARLDPDNRTGTGAEDILSHNFSWSMRLVGIARRSCLNLGLP